jgi:putative transcriptional regulator
MKTRMKEYRARHDLTQEQLGKIVGARRETISFVEKGRYNPSLRLAWKIARALDSTVDELFLFDDEVDGGDERS